MLRNYFDRVATASSGCCETVRQTRLAVPVGGSSTRDMSAVVRGRVWKLVPAIAAIVLLCFAVAAVPRLALAQTLDFDLPVPGTIQDTNGLGTGFTHRLPGTGSLIPVNDPNMDLLGSPGRLRLTSADSDINGSRNLGILEAVGFLMPGIGTADFALQAKFDGVNVVNASDQLFLFAGISATQVVRAGFHDGNVYHITSNQAGADSIDFATGPGAFISDDDVVLTLARTAGLWTIAWDNLSHPEMSGVSTPEVYPWLDASPYLYLGVHAANARNRISFTSEIDWIDVRVSPIPEPSSCLLGASSIAALAIAGGIRRLVRRG